MTGTFDHLAALLSWSQSRPERERRRPRIGAPGEPAEVELHHESDWVTECVANHAVLAAPYEPYDPAELRLARDKLQRALDLIFATNSTSLAMIESALRRIGIRKRSCDPAPHGITRMHLIGTVFVRNPQTDQASILELSEILVHESLHSYLLTLEQATPIFTHGRRVMIERSVPSPWTGKQIELYAYFHAVAVWYCLSRFLSAVPSSESEPWIERRLHLIRRGFAKLDQQPYASLHRLTNLEPSFARTLHRWVSAMREEEPPNPERPLAGAPGPPAS